MPNIEQQLGFEYGYPGPTQQQWYGLWSALFDCFLMVSYDLDLLKDIQMLCASKSALSIVILDPENYQNNILDNSCCNQWTIADLAGYEFNRVWFITGQNFVKVSIQQNNRPYDSQVEKLQTWILMLTYNLRRFQEIKNINRVEIFVNTVFDLDDCWKTFEKQFYKTLLLNEDPVQTQLVIDQIIKKFCNDQDISH